ncbi:MAG: DUF362 domain-containing protein [candidate division NC10 bacterium]|nr:DUF362 domain-containing protein [candidate division NC10 bacterium]
MAIKSRVVIVRSKKAVRADGRVDGGVLQRMVEKGLLQLTASPSPQEAWSSLFSPRDRVGIKVNSIGGQLLSPTPAWVPILAQGLREAGMDESRILFWDRSSRELKEAGFPLHFEGRGVRCFGTDAEGVGYGPELVESGSIGSLLSRILTSLTTAQINLAILKDHNLSGLSCALKNLYGAIHNPNKYHDQGCDPYIADLYGLPQIHQKFRLNLCEALRVQYHGGPAFKSQWIENYQGILLSRDAVALDFVAWRLLDRIRRAHGLPSLEQENRAPTYILTAGDARHHLGNCRESDLEILEYSL